MNIIGYIRVSTDEQADSGAGLQAQRTTIEQETQQRGWTLTDILEDPGYSAKNMRRPAIQQALEMLHRGEASGLMVAKLDRLSRSLQDFTTIIETARHQKWSLVCLDINVDTSTPAGEAMASILAVFSQYERRLIGQRTREGLAAKRQAGVILGRPQKISFELRSRMRVELSTGASLAAVARGLNREGVPTAQGGVRWWPSTVRAAVRVPA